MNGGGGGLEERMRELLQCPICRDTMVHPCTLPDCGHMACTLCLGGIRDNRCPVCRDVIVTVLLPNKNRHVRDMCALLTPPKVWADVGHRFDVAYGVQRVLSKWRRLGDDIMMHRLALVAKTAQRTDLAALEEQVLAADALKEEERRLVAEHTRARSERAELVSAMRRRVLIATIEV